MKTYGKHILIVIIIITISTSWLFGQIPTTNLKAWYIGDSVALTSGFVSEWTDYSGNNFHLQQSNFSKMPSQTSQLFNIHSAIRFDGTNDYLVSDFGESFSQPVTIFIVWKKNATKQQNIFDGIDANSLTLNYPYSVTEGLAMYAGGVGVGLSYTKTLTTNLTVSSLIFDATSKIFDNGIQKGSSTLVGTNSIGGLTVGAMYNFAGNLNGDITELIFYNSNLSDIDRQIVENYLMTKYSPPLDLGSDINITYGLCDTTLIIDASYSDILWSTGETNDTINVDANGSYFVQAKDIFGRMRYDTINVSFLEYSLVNSKICLGDSVLYDLGLVGSYDYFWSDSDIGATKYYQNEGNYWLRIEDSFGCFDTVFFSVDVDSFKNLIDLGNDTSLCSGNSISLISGEELCTQFLWTPGSSVESFQIVNASGWQHLEVQNLIGCAAIDSVFVTISGTAPVPLYSVVNLCFGDITEFTDNSTPTGGITLWKWIINTNDTIVSQNCQFTFDNPGMQEITLYVEGDGGCSNELDFEININENPVSGFSYLPICVGYEMIFNSVVDVPAGTNIESFSWSIDNVYIDNTEDLPYTFSAPSTYTLELNVQLDNGCSNVFSDNIVVPDSYPLIANPVCVYPSNNIVISASSSDFIWNTEENIFFYELLISEDSLFTNILLTESNLHDANTSIDLSSLSDTVYWKIRAYNPCYQYTESDFESFIIYSVPQSTHLKLWSAADSILLNSGFVETMYDKSGNNFHFSQSNLTKAPILVTNAFNNRQYLRFDGSNDFMKSNFGQSFGQPASIFVLWKHNLMKNQNIFDSYSSPGWSFYYPYSVTNALVATAGSIGGMQYNKPMSQHHSLNSIIFGLQSKLYENGILKTSGTTVGTNSIDGFTLGSVNATNLQFLNGDIAEIIYFDTVLNDDERILVENYLHDKYFPPINLGYDIRIPYNFCDTTITTAYKPWFTSYEWSTGETDSIISVNKSGIYSCTVTDIFGITSIDDIRVSYPEVNNFSDTTVCFGETVIWDTEITGAYDFEWYGSSDISNSITITNLGQYAAIITDSLGCKYKTDTINFNLDDYAFNASVGPTDTLLCSGNFLSLITNASETVSYLWSTGSTNSEITVESSDTYTVTATNWRGCTAIDMINVNIIGTAPIPAYSVQNLCFGETTQFLDNSTPIGEIATWEWIINTSDTLHSQNIEFLFSNFGQQNISFAVADAAGCASKLDFDITIKEIPEVSFSYQPVCTGLELTFNSDVIIPNETVIDSYLWEINGLTVATSENLNYTFVSSGNYNLEFEVLLDNNCMASFSETISVQDSYPIPENLSCVFPLNNSINSSESINFTWNASDNTLFYEILIAEDSLFNNLLIDQTNISDNDIDININTTTNTVFWKIKAFNPCLTFSESEIYKFFIYRPNQLENLELWSCTDSVLINSGYAEIMYDLSGNGFDFTQSNSTKRPIVISDEFNNRDFLSFDGVNDFMKCDFGMSIPQPATIFVIWKNNIMKNQNIFGSFATPGFSFYFPYSVTNTLIATASTVGGMQYEKPLSENNTLSTIVFNTQSYVFENGILKANTSTVGTNSMDGFTLGSTFETDQRFLNGNIAEIIFYDTVLSDTDRQMVERYLHDKYFPPVNLGYDIRIPYGFCDTAITTAYKPWFTDYEWSTGETDSVIHVNRPGIYSVTVTDIFGITSSDDIRIFYPEVNDFADTIVCNGASVVWDTELVGDYTYEWYGSSELTQAITITNEGPYAAILTDSTGCKYYSDTISFSFDNYEFTTSIGPTDTALCNGNRLLLLTNADETVSYDWSTGSTNPEIVLTESGTYSVSVTNWRGCQAVDAVDVTITGFVPFPAFSSLGHCAQNPVLFTDLSTAPDGEIISWIWSINGEIFSTDQNPVLAESNPQLETLQPETVEITLVISTNVGCSDFIINPLSIFPLPVISFTPESFCQNAEIEFTSTSAVNGGSVVYNFWEFSEETRVGSITLPRDSIAWYQQREDLREAGSSVTHTFTTAGNHTVKLLSSSNESCTDSLTTEIYVKPAELPVYSVEKTCLGHETWFINQTPYNTVNPGESWHWNFGDGGTASVSNPSHSYASAGTFNTSVEITFANKCVTSASLPVEVYNTPVVDISASDECIGVAFSPASNVSSASGNIISYHWLMGDTDITESVLQNPEFLLSEEGLYPISLEVETQYLCTNSDRDTITVHALPVADFTTSRNWGSVPLWIDFTNASVGASTYVWDFGTGETSTEENPYYIFTDSGSFVVRLLSVSEFGCEDYEEHQIKSVIPVMDVILYNLRSEMSGNYLQTRVYIINNGTLPVNNLEMLLNLGDGKIYREVIEYLAPSQVLDYKFVFEAWIADGTVPELVCAEAIAPAYEGHTDSDLSNNTICNTDVDNLKVLQPYPNPATDQIICEFILSETSNVEISLVNSLGEVVYKTEFKDRTTYTKHIISVKDFVQGVYFLQVRAGSEKVSYKVEVQ